MMDKRKELMERNEIKKSFLSIICFVLQCKEKKSHPTNHHSCRVSD